VRHLPSFDNEMKRVKEERKKMKTTNNKKILLMLALFLGLSFCNSTYAHAEVSYLGEFCVYQNDNTFKPPLLVTEFGALYYGDNHFVLNGVVPGVPGLNEPVQGTGVITGNTFVATLVSSFVGTTISFTVSNLVLNFPPVGAPSDVISGTMTSMTIDLSQPTAQSNVTTIPIYMTVCE